jgi:acyl-CoA synthetase (AMP-forming)/AMP-acid ligase II
LRDTSCHRVLTTRESLKPLLDDIRLHLTDAPFGLTFEEMPSLPEIFPKLGHEKPSDPFRPYPIGPRPSPEDILIYFHSSGSTGFPKTVAQVSQTILHWASRREHLS